MTSNFRLGQPFVGAKTRIHADGVPRQLLFALGHGRHPHDDDEPGVTSLGYGAAELRTPTTMLALGGSVAGHWAGIPDLAALGKRVRPANLVVVALPERVPFHGLLGLDFLRGSRLTVDFRRGEIELET